MRHCLCPTCGASLPIMPPEDGVPYPHIACATCIEITKVLPMAERPLLGKYIPDVGTSNTGGSRHNMKEYVRIETEHAVFGTKILDAAGQPIAEKVTDVEFRHKAGELPTLTVTSYAQETVIEGEVEVKRILICPACRKELQEKSSGEAVHLSPIVNGDGFSESMVGPRMGLGELLAKEIGATQDSDG